MSVAFVRLIGRSKLICASVLLAGCVPSRPANDPATASSESDSVDVAAPASARTAEAKSTSISDERAETPAAASRDGRALDRGRLVREVLARNPDIEARRAAWRAARARRGQVGSWEDPMLAYEIAPLSVFSGMRVGQTVRLSQSIPWPGKLSSREKAEEQEAAAGAEEVKLTELDMALETSMLYDELWFVDRSLEVNAEHNRLLGELKSAAEIQYSVGKASLSDPLQAEVELAMLSEQVLGLGSQRDVVIAELNALLHRDPTRPLPAPPRELPVVFTAPPPSKELQAEALTQSPELRKLAARARSADSRVRYAEREYYPDVTLMASYSSMFPELEHQFMVGFETPLPIQRGSRGSMVEEASAMASEVRSEARRVGDKVKARVETERRRVLESLELVKLYDNRLIPTSKNQVAAARNDFAAGNADFSTVISAEKNLRNIQLSRHMMVAELSKRRARLDRSRGRLPHGIQKAGGK